MVAEFSRLLITLLTVLIGTLSGVIAWLVRKVWILKTKDIASNSARIRSLEEQMRGYSEGDSGFTGEVENNIKQLNESIEELQSTLESAEESRKRRHMEVRLGLKKVIEVLQDSDMNGDLPEPEDLEE